MINSTEKNKPLDGLRFVVTAIDLEQDEHRGIAVYSKGILRALKRSGAEVWLLTQFDGRVNDLSSRKIPRNTKQFISYARVLEGLNTGRPDTLIEKILNPIPLVNLCTPSVLKAQNYLSGIFVTKKYKSSKLKYYPLRELFDSPYLQAERLSYLGEIDGLICASDIFINSFRLASRKNNRPLRINLEGFHGLITTCPLHIQPTNPMLFIQTVHDIIPLEYVQTTDHVAGFARRLHSCSKAVRLFVSETTRHKFNKVVLAKNQEKFHKNNRTLMQSPSMQFPGDALDWEAQMSTLSINKKLVQTNKYLLFNSSVEPRKNLLFALKAYIESGVELYGIQFCITGMLKRDKYSKEVKKIVEEHPTIFLTGYVDEATKRRLYLNALALISPSLVEGFGIPVLDAACLGLPVIASTSASHHEIKQLHDFNEHILLCSTLHTSDWASAMRLITLKANERKLGINNESLPSDRNKIRIERIKRYRKYQKLIDANFDKTICELILEELHTKQQVDWQGNSKANQ